MPAWSDILSCWLFFVSLAPFFFFFFQFSTPGRRPPLIVLQVRTVFWWSSSGMSLPESADVGSSSSNISLYILDVKPLSDLSFTNIFSHTVVYILFYWWCLLLYRSFSAYYSPSCSFLLLFSLPGEICSRRGHSCLCLRGFCLFFSKSLMVSWLTFRSLIHFEFTFVDGAGQ